MRRAPADLGGFLEPKQAESFLREAGFKSRGHVLVANPAKPADRKGARVVDAWKVDPGPPARTIAREAKVGEQHLSDSTRKQIDKDVALRADGRINDVSWHSFPSQASRRVADDEALFDALREAGIPYYIHLS